MQLKFKYSIHSHAASPLRVDLAVTTTGARPRAVFANRRPQG